MLVSTILAKAIRIEAEQNGIGKVGEGGCLNLPSS